MDVLNRYNETSTVKTTWNIELWAWRVVAFLSICGLPQSIWQ